jgi:putative transposase
MRTERVEKIEDSKQDNKVATASELISLKSETQIVRCKRCGSFDIMKYGTRKGVQEYICRTCRRKFTAKDTTYKKKTPANQIGVSLDMYYNGISSLSGIAQYLATTCDNPVSESTVYRWVTDYTLEAINTLDHLKPIVSDTWLVDETRVAMACGNSCWFWDVVDEKTGFLLASHLSMRRTSAEISTALSLAKEIVDYPPSVVVSDGNLFFPKEIDKIFGVHSLINIQSQGFTDEIKNNIIEPLHSTLEKRNKIIHGSKSLDSAGILLRGYRIHYNFFKPHLTCYGKTAAELAGINTSFKTWTDFARLDNR